MLKLQYFGHLMWKTDSLEKILMLGNTEGGRRRGRQRIWLMTSLTRWTWVWVNSRRWWLTGEPGGQQSMGSQRVRHDRDWTYWLSIIRQAFATGRVEGSMTAFRTWQRGLGTPGRTGSSTTELQTGPPCPAQGRLLAFAHVHPMPSAEIPSWGLAQALLASFFPHIETFYFSTR